MDGLLLTTIAGAIMGVWVFVEAGIVGLGDDDGGGHADTSGNQH